MKKLLLMAAFVMATLSYSGQLCAQSKKVTPKRKSTTTAVKTPATTNEKRIVGGNQFSTEIRSTSDKPLERAKKRGVGRQRVSSTRLSENKSAATVKGKSGKVKIKK